MLRFYTERQQLPHVDLIGLAAYTTLMPWPQIGKQSWPALQVSEHAAMVGDRDLIMPRAQHAMLWALARSNAQVVTWVAMHHALWPDEFYLTQDCLYSHLSRLRADLKRVLVKTHPALTTPIRTVHHVGLQLRWPPDRLRLEYPRPHPGPTATCPD